MFRQRNTEGLTRFPCFAIETGEGGLFSYKGCGQSASANLALEASKYR